MTQINRDGVITHLEPDILEFEVKWALRSITVGTGFIPIPKKGNAKEYSNYHTIALISLASKVMLNILQSRLQRYVIHELPDVQADFRKGRGTRDQIANIHWIVEKARELQKNIYFCFFDYAKAFDCVDHNKLENSERDGSIRPCTCLLRNLSVVKNQQLELNQEELLVQNW